jgi:hypothetical protein
MSDIIQQRGERQMFERSTRGVRYQLTGLNMWVVALVLGFGLTVLAESFFGFILAGAILLLAVVGLVMFIVGLVFILLGGKEVGNTSWAVGSLLLLILSPFVIMGGIFNVYPMNFIIVHLGLWMLFASLVMPYIKMGGMVTGVIAIVIESVMVIYTLSVMLASNLGITTPVVMSLMGGYFLFLEFSIIISYLRMKKKQSELQIIEGDGEKEVEVPVSGKPAPGRESGPIGKRSGDLTFGAPRPSPSGGASRGDFKVLEYEFSRASRTMEDVDDTELFKGIPTAGQRAREERKKRPVVGRALNFEEAVKRTEAAFDTARTEPKEGERYTVEDEEEIDISFDDLYIDGQNLYEILKLDISASSNDIKKAYRKRAILFHPDKNRDMGPLYAETIGMEMRKLNTAKAILLDPAKRSIYDRLLRSVI